MSTMVVNHTCHQQNRVTIISREHDELCCTVKNSPFGSFLEHYRNSGHKLTAKRQLVTLQRKYHIRSGMPFNESIKLPRKKITGSLTMLATLKIWYAF